MKTKTGNSKFLKQMNQANVLDLIRVHRAISRAELAEMTGLSPTAAGVITSVLLKKGYIHETGIGESSGGRRPILLGLKPNSYYTVGIDLDAGDINLMILDITGRIVHEETKSFDNELPPGMVMKIINKAAEAALEKLNIDRKKVLGIGISIAGIVDEKNREVLLAPNLSWENTRLSLEPFEGLNVPLYVQNEARCSAIAENWLGTCQGIDDFVCINIRSGIGSGIFSGGKLFSGIYGSAGEIGHITVKENGAKCGCGNFGCLETIASTTGMIKKAKEYIKQGKIQGLNSKPDFNFENLVEAARKGDAAAILILDESARYLGIAISYIINILNPARVVIGKEFTKYADLVLDDIKAVVESKTLKIAVSNISIETSCLGEKSSALGAAIIPLKVLFGR